jgi:hypothetical protein
MNEDEKKGAEEGESEEIPQLIPIVPKVAPEVGPKKKVEDIPCIRCSCIVHPAYMQCRHCKQASCDECYKKGCLCRSKQKVS